MPNTMLEERVTALERKVAQFIKHSSSPPEKDWRRTIGMFANNDLMKEIDEEGRKVREADREQTRRDHS